MEGHVPVHFKNVSLQICATSKMLRFQITPLCIILLHFQIFPLQIGFASNVLRFQNLGFIGKGEVVGVVATYTYGEEVVI